jgi:hypothetical protein
VSRPCPVEILGSRAMLDNSISMPERPGFKARLDRIAANGVRCILVESPDRFTRVLTVQLTDHDFLKSLGISLIPATAPDFFRGVRTNQRSTLSSTISARNLPCSAIMRPTVMGRWKRRGPALPGLKKSVPFFVSILGWCE